MIILHNTIYPTDKANTKTNKGMQYIVDTTEIRKILSVRIMETRLNGKTPCGKFLWFNCGENFCSNSRVSRILSTVNALTTWSIFYMMLPRVAKVRPSMMSEWILITTCKNLVWSTRIGRIIPTWMLLMRKSQPWDWSSARNSKRSIFLNFFQVSVRQTMIQNLITNGQDQDVWHEAEDEITNLLHDDTILTLENTSASMKRAETYLKRETTTTDNHDVVLKDGVSYSRQILAFKIKLTHLKVVQTTVTTT